MDDDEQGLRLLGQLESILHHDPLIDEVGFLHPSQLVTLHPLKGKDPTASFAGDTLISTIGRSNTGTEASQKSSFEGFSGKFIYTFAEAGDTYASREVSYERSVFWCGDHKLAISVQYLPLLYKTAKSAYVSAYKQYKSLVDLSQNGNHLPEDSSETIEELRHTVDLEVVENELMNHSKVVVLLSCDYASAWNSRKQVISRKPLQEVYEEELRLSRLVISYAPKSEQAWSYRYWLIRLTINNFLSSKEVFLILERESDFVEQVGEKSHMNYRAWRHRYRLVDHMSTSKVLNELHRTKKWAQLHVGDNCCFHYRRCLLLKLEQMESNASKGGISISPEECFKNFQNHIKGVCSEYVLLLKEELDWNKNLITYYFGREALWIHRRFLFHQMIQQASFQYNHTSSSATNHRMNPNKEVSKDDDSDQPVPLHLFLEEEFEFTDLCINNSDNSCEDTSKQREYATMYKIWMILHLRQVNESQELLERIEKDQKNLKVMLETLCPQRIVLYEGLFQSKMDLTN